MRLMLESASGWHSFLAAPLFLLLVTPATGYAATTYSVSISVAGTGTVTSSPAGIDCGADCEGTFSEGEVVTLTATAPPGWAIQSWGGDCSGRGSCRLAVNGAKNVTTTFAESAFTETRLPVPGAPQEGRVAWGDYDGDGDLDLAAAWQSGAGARAVVYRNTLGELAETIVLPENRAPVAWGDFDNDGNLDLVLGEYNECGGWLYCLFGTGLLWNGAGSFSRVEALQIHQSAVAWGDYDNDGDLDLAIAGTSPALFGGAAVTALYRNDHGVLADSGTTLLGVHSADLAWGDFDGDGDLDLVVAGQSDDAGPLTVLYRNEGGSLVAVASDLPGVSNASVAWADYDGDGDLDLALAGESLSGPLTMIARNDAGELVDSGITLTGVYSGSVTWADYDGDGDSDLLVHGKTGETTSVTTLYRNDDGAFEAVFSGLPDVHSGTAAWGDYDNDGRIDLALSGVNDTTGDSSYLGVFRSIASGQNTPPQPPDGIVMPLPSGETMRWIPGSDAETPGAALTYNVRIGTTPGGSDVVSAMADPTTGYRRVAAAGNAGHRLSYSVKGLAPGLYYWAVQTIDASFAGSAFSPAWGFVVPEPVTWTAAVGVAVSGDTLTKTAATGWGNAGAVSKQTIGAPGGVLDFTASETTSYRMLGLSHGSTSNSWDDIEFALYLFGGQIQIYEAGSLKGTFGSYSTGDHLSIAAAGSLVTYSRNGSILYTSTRTPIYPLLVDCALYSQNATLASAVISNGTPLPTGTEAVVWTSLVGVSASGNNLTKTSATAWGNAGAVSTQRITSGDGFVEFWASETSTHRMLGLSNGNTSSSWDDIDFGLYLFGGQIQIYEAGSLKGTFGSYATGDRLRIAVDGGVVSYSRNGTVFYASTRAPVYPLLVDCALYSQNATLSAVVISTPAPQSLPPGTQPVTWTSLVGVTSSGNSLTKTAATAWGNAGAVSKQSIGWTGGHVEFTASETTSHRMLGLSNGNASSSWDDIDFALYLSAGQIQVYEAGSLKGSFGSYASGDTLRIAANGDAGGAVTYSRNGTVFYQSANPPFYPLLVDCALYSRGATLSSVVIWTLKAPALGPEPVTWTSLTGVTAIGNKLTKTAATAWGNAGAVSTQTIASGDGYVELTASETTTARMLGLSRGNTNSSWDDIDFSLYLYGSQIQVYEASTLRGSFGAYASGDILRVAVTGGVVTYSRNGTVFYTSGGTPSYPLLVDSALYSQNATLDSVVIAGAQ